MSNNNLAISKQNSIDFKLHFEICIKDFVFIAYNYKIVIIFQLTYFSSVEIIFGWTHEVTDSSFVFLMPYLIVQDS